MEKRALQKMLRRAGGILLDIGCGDHKQAGFVGMDKRKIPGIVDIVHDLEVFPYPLPDESCLTIIGSHIIEHIKPWFTIDVMDELWRITKVGGQLVLSHPYAGSPPYWQDPTHCNGCTEATWQYFDPRYPLWQVYKPKPWNLEPGFPVWKHGGCMEVLFRKVSEKTGLQQGEKTPSPWGEGPASGLGAGDAVKIKKG